MKSTVEEMINRLNIVRVFPEEITLNDLQEGKAPCCICVGEELCRKPERCEIYQKWKKEIYKRG